MYLSLSLLTLSVRNLGENRARSALGIGIVALGVATMIAVNTTGASVLSSISSSPDAQAFIGGLLDQFDQLLMGIGLMITLVTGFLMFNSFFLSVTQRRRQIGALRLLGVTWRQVLGVVLGEAVLIGALGALLGILIGPLLGKGTISLIEAALGEGIFTFQDTVIPFMDLVIPAGLGLGVTFLAVLLPARRAREPSSSGGTPRAVLETKFPGFSYTCLPGFDPGGPAPCHRRGPFAFWPRAASLGQSGPCFRSRALADRAWDEPSFRHWRLRPPGRKIVGAGPFRDRAIDPGQLPA